MVRVVVLRSGACVGERRGVAVWGVAKALATSLKQAHMWAVSAGHHGSGLVTSVTQWCCGAWLGSRVVSGGLNGLSMVSVRIIGEELLEFAQRLFVGPLSKVSSQSRAFGPCKRGGRARALA